jgi:dihydrofolate synthase/folylpolyglutamate synthase
LEQIAAEKAGIIQPHPDGSPACVLTAAENEVVLEIIRSRCRENGAELIRVQEFFSAEVSSDPLGCFSVVTTLPDKRVLRFRIPLPGKHQVLNALTAIGAISQLGNWGIPVSPRQMEEGIASTWWPGRLELAARDPRIILDGAHNPAGAAILAEFLGTYCQREKTLLLFGVMQDKEFRSMGMTLFPLARAVILTRAAWSRAASPEEIREALPEFAEQCLVIHDLEQALETAWEMASVEDTIVLAGSLFLVGEARDLLEKKGKLISP